MHIILTGATGLVGSAVLDAMLKTKDITKITLLSRRPVQQAIDRADPRVTVLTPKDFTRLDADPSLLSQLRDAQGCVWALGISQSQVGPEEYVIITKDMALSAARAFSSIAAETRRPFNFVFVSGAGTTFRPGMFTPIFARVKGETEQDLAGMRGENPLLRADSVRPSFVDAAAHESVKGYIPDVGLGRRVMLGTLGPVIRMGAKGQWSPTEPLGRFLTEVAMGRWDGRLEGEGTEKVGASGFTVVENNAFRRFMGL